MRSIRYTRHASAKFEVLKRYGFGVTPDQVEETLYNPERLLEEDDGAGRFIAQKRITERHVLRVVYRQEGEMRVVITFYPERRDRYEA